MTIATSAGGFWGDVASTEMAHTGWSYHSHSQWPIVPLQPSSGGFFVVPDLGVQMAELFVAMIYATFGAGSEVDDIAPYLPIARRRLAGRLRNRIMLQPLPADMDED